MFAKIKSQYLLVLNDRFDRVWTYLMGERFNPQDTKIKLLIFQWQLTGKNSSLTAKELRFHQKFIWSLVISWVLFLKDAHYCSIFGHGSLSGLLHACSVCSVQYKTIPWLMYNVNLNLRLFANQHIMRIYM